jgi:putative phosphoesterase
MKVLESSKAACASIVMRIMVELKNNGSIMKKAFQVGAHSSVGDRTMIVGIMSDTHDNLPLVEKAIERLNQEKAEIVLHAGDYVAPFTIVRFKHLKAKLIGVFGNNDGDHELLKKRFAEVNGAEIRGSFAEIDVEELKIALLHDDGELLQSLVNTQCYDMVVHGHSHEARIFMKGKTTVINPGEVCGYLSGKSTMVLLDTETRETKIIQL